MAVEFTPLEWQNKPDHTTPMSAANLTRIETAVAALADVINNLPDSSDLASTDYVDTAVDNSKPLPLAITDALPSGLPDGTLVVRY